MLELRDFMPVNFLKKEKFTGSHNGMRFRMEKLDLEGEDGPRLGVTIGLSPMAMMLLRKKKRNSKSCPLTRTALQREWTG